jgi:hypothetical protein
VRDAAPLRVLSKKSGERLWVALIERLRCRTELVDHRLGHSGNLPPSAEPVASRAEPVVVPVLGPSLARSLRELPARPSAGRPQHQQHETLNGKSVGGTVA